MRGRLHPPWPCDHEQIPASPRASVFLIWRMGLQPRPHLSAFMGGHISRESDMCTLEEGDRE